MKKKEVKIFDYPIENIEKIKRIWEPKGWRIRYKKDGVFVLVIDNYITCMDPIKIRFSEYDTGERTYSAEYYEDWSTADVDMDTFKMIQETLSILNWC